MVHTVQSFNNNQLYMLKIDNENNIFVLFTVRNGDQDLSYHQLHWSLKEKWPEKQLLLGSIFQPGHIVDYKQPL